ncbi:hypothetical protein P4N68_04455 [Corynebacterium felinum]|uniref:Uncharacterized protein n=1 Tax=Corynebacterium felinum TaxID=131318 RepID=A0ABU2B8I9_9CORY|nr:hypothetical protein [Corynebacterium felinum]MDF5820337.1 hypothetical protein [Corynebacterium felinum]MDR7353704.1 hypothetical protein [Corynebacterium felinum]WJY95883.1 hypothetical protein CFELI_11465 [Corynebacterium felinum]
MARNTARRMVVGAHTCALLSVCTVPVPALAYTEYDLWVGSDRVTSVNQKDVRGDGTIRFDPTTSTLHFNGVNLKDRYDRTDETLNNSFVIYSKLKDTSINVQGTNQLILEPKSSAELAAGIMHEGDGTLSFVGDGSLSISTENPELTNVGRHGISSYGKTIFTGPEVSIQPGLDQAGWGLGVNTLNGMETAQGVVNIHTTRSGFGIGASNGPVIFTGGVVNIKAEFNESDLFATAVGVNAAEITLGRAVVTVEADAKAFSNDVKNEGTGTLLVNTEPSEDGAMPWDQLVPLGGGNAEWKFVKFTPHQPLTTVPHETKNPPSPAEERRENSGILVFMLLGGIACVLAIFALLLRGGRRTH